MDENKLLREAYLARRSAYAPYSKYCVGAALLGKSGKIYRGCNIENASFGAGICAERCAFSKAVSEGEREFIAVAIVGGGENAEKFHFCPPCGICRQFMREFCDPERFRIILEDTDLGRKSFLLGELLPEGFGPETVAQV